MKYANGDTVSFQLSQFGAVHPRMPRVKLTINSINCYLGLPVAGRVRCDVTAQISSSFSPQSPSKGMRYFPEVLFLPSLLFGTY